MSETAKQRTLIIFDVDGTLVDAHDIDNTSFNRAFTEVTGIEMTESLWSGFTEVTSQATIHQALGKEPSENLSSVKERVRDSFLARLRSSHHQNPISIRPFVGAVDVLSALKRNPGISVAIATGCWRETAHFKLSAAGFDLTDIPFASASDCYTRAEIISLAAERAGVPVEHSIYVGDGVWDYRATRQLGIPFIGTGRKINKLRQAGAEHTFDEWKESVLLAILARIRGLNGTDPSTSSG